MDLRKAIELCILYVRMQMKIAEFPQISLVEICSSDDAWGLCSFPGTKIYIWGEKVHTCAEILLCSIYRFTE